MIYVGRDDSKNSMSHYGVLGMKWGVRRYQNKDGSYKKGAEGRYNDKITKKKSGGMKIQGMGDVQGGGTGAAAPVKDVEELAKDAEEVEDWDEVKDDGNCEQYIMVPPGPEALKIFKAEDGKAFTIANGKYVYGDSPEEVWDQVLTRKKDGYTISVAEDGTYSVTGIDKYNMKIGYGKTEAEALKNAKMLAATEAHDKRNNKNHEAQVATKAIERHNKYYSK